MPLTTADILGRATAIAYIAVLAILSVYGIHRFYILYLFFRYYKRAKRTAPAPLDPARCPTVTVQLPIYNELYVAARVIESVSHLEYPKDRLVIQVLDDSTDGTRDVARKAVADLRRRGFDAQYLHREDRKGFKAGALRAGLKKTDSELVAIFDADFIVPRDFLSRVVPYFEDARVGMVQSRWGYLNRNYSLLTRIQSILLDGQFVIEHTARSFSGRFFNFNGTGGVWRRRAIDSAGGWDGATLTEDLDLSYRAQMAGWKFVYLPDLVCESELPVDIYGLKTQQHRWTKGAVQVGKKLLPVIWRSALPLRVKVEATFHLTANVCCVMVVLVSVLLPLTLVLGRHFLLDGVRFWELMIFVLTTGSVFVFYMISQREVYPDWKRRLKDIPFILVLGIGMCVNSAWAVAEALLSRETPFVRTAKYRIENFRDGWKGKIYRSVNTRSVLVEGLFAVYISSALVLLFAIGNWTAVPYVLLFAGGYIYVLGLSVSHARR